MENVHNFTPKRDVAKDIAITRTRIQNWNWQNKTVDSIFYLLITTDQKMQLNIQTDMQQKGPDVRHMLSGKLYCASCIVYDRPIRRLKTFLYKSLSVNALRLRRPFKYILTVMMILTFWWLGGQSFCWLRYSCSHIIMISREFNLISATGWYTSD